MADFLLSTSADLRLTEALAAEYALLLADRFSLLGHPAIQYWGNCAGRGSNVIKVPLAGLGGYDRMSGVAEGSSVPATSVTDSSALITVARQAIKRNISDINNLVDSVGINVEALIADGVGAYAMRWMELLTGLLGNFTATVGTSGSDLTADQFFSAQFTLIQASVPGPYLMVLYPTQWTDLAQSVRGETGPFSLRSDAQAIFSAIGQGFMGSLAGCDVVASSLIPTANAGADSAGGMFGAGAVGFADGLPTSIRGASEVLVPAGARMYTTIKRDDDAALTGVVHNAYLGMSILQNAKGVSIITDR